MRISKSGKLTVSLTCESASPGSRRFPRHANQQVREARVSRKIWMRIQKNLDSAVNPARRLTFDSSLSHSFLCLRATAALLAQPVRYRSRSLRREGPMAFLKPLTDLQERNQCHKTQPKQNRSKRSAATTRSRRPKTWRLRTPSIRVYSPTRRTILRHRLTN